jgi:hypothetical protein
MPSGSDPQSAYGKFASIRRLTTESKGSTVIALNGEKMIRKIVILCALAHLILLVPFTGAVASEQKSFDGLSGSWSGSGAMKSSDGPHERVKCKAEYIVKNEGRSLELHFLCASEAYKMNLSANIKQEGSALYGNWFESQYHQGGKLTGQHANGLIEARIESDTIVALLTVHTKGERQSFVMEAPGAWVSQVSIDLLRDHR